jgi:uncharacterized protein (TIGR00369 family)
MADRTMQDLAQYFGTETTRTGERTTTTRVAIRDALCDASGAVRAGVVTFAADMATGLAMGLAVLDRNLWTVTTDLDVHVPGAARSGTLRIDVDVLRAGETTAVSAFTVHDEDSGRCIGGGTGTGRPFPFDFDRANLEVPVGAVRNHGATGEPSDEPLVSYLGLRAGEDGSVEVDVADWLRNPWGILHGGVTSCLADLSAETAGSAALGRPARITDEMVRFLAPGRVGPVRAVPTVLAVTDDRALVEVRIVDAGKDDRLVAVSTLTVA